MRNSHWGKIKDRKHRRLIFTYALSSPTPSEKKASPLQTRKNARFRERLPCPLRKDRGRANGEVAQMLLVVPETITDGLPLLYATFPRLTQAIDAFFADIGRYRDALTTLTTANFEMLTRP